VVQAWARGQQGVEGGRLLLGLQCHHVTHGGVHQPLEDAAGRGSDRKRMHNESPGCNDGGCSGGTNKQCRRVTAEGRAGSMREQGARDEQGAQGEHTPVAGRAGGVQSGVLTWLRRQGWLRSRPAERAQHLGNVPGVLARKRPRDEVPVHHHLAHTVLGQAQGRQQLVAPAHDGGCTERVAPAACCGGPPRPSGAASGTAALR